MKHALFQAYLNKYSGYVDGGMGLTFVTGELDAELMAKILELHRVPVTIYATEGNITKEDAEMLDGNTVHDTEIKAPKTPSQRLRNTLFLVWSSDKELTEQFPDFDTDYYPKKMEEIIEFYKEKIK